MLALPFPVPDHDGIPAGSSRESSDGEVTRALAAWRDGTPGALDRLMPLLYQDLRRLARQRLRSERDGHTLGTTALAHEAYIRLSTLRQFQPADRDAFFAAASNTMRRVLVDYARARSRAKRGDGAPSVPLDEVEPLLPEQAIEETIALDTALTRLAATFPRAASVVEQRLFGGLTNEEVARANGVSPKTAQRDWEAARAWLRKEIGRTLPTP